MDFSLIYLITHNPPDYCKTGLTEHTKIVPPFWGGTIDMDEKNGSGLLLCCLFEEEIGHLFEGIFVEGNRTVLTVGHADEGFQTASLLQRL